jgi:hypothetical protein
LAVYRLNLIYSRNEGPSFPTLQRLWDLYRVTLDNDHQRDILSSLGFIGDEFKQEELLYWAVYSQEVKQQDIYCVFQSVGDCLPAGPEVNWRFFQKVSVLSLLSLLSDHALPCLCHWNSTTRSSELNMKTV